MAATDPAGVLSGIAFTLFYVVLGVPIARLADEYSRKRHLMIRLRGTVRIILGTV